MRRQDDEPAISLWLLTLCLVGLGLFLAAVAGGPSMPSVPADWASFESALRGTATPVDGLLIVVRDAAWIVWGWFGLSFELQAASLIAERFGPSNARARQLRDVCDWLSFPPVRKAMRAAVAGSVFVQVATTGLSYAHAAPLEPVAAQTVSRDEGEFGSASNRQQADESSTPSTIYAVKRGDTLASIAQHFYGDNTQWRRIYAANQGRTMADGASFTQAGVIRPGWTLNIPDIAPPEEVDATGRTIYTVQKGDTLWDISDRELGDATRYGEIFDNNVGTQVGPYTLRNPNLIWPGLRLVVKGAPETPAAPAPPPPPTAPPPAAPATPQPAATDEAPAVVADSTTDEAPVLAEQPVVETARPVATEQHSSAPPTLPIGLAVLGMAGIAGGGAVAARRRRNTAELPVAKPLKGFVAWQPEALPGERRLARVFADVMRNQPAKLVAGYAAAETGTLVLDVAAANQETLTATAEALGATSTEVGRDRVRWDLPRWPRRSAMGEEESVLPLGMSAEQRVLYAPWPKFGHLLLTGDADAGVRTALEAVIADMATRLTPDRLGLYFVGQELPEILAQLPHARGPIIDSDDQDHVDMLVKGLASRDSTNNDRVDVLVVSEWMNVAPVASALLDPEFTKRGLRIIAACTALDETTADAIRPFRNRLVFHVADEPTSMALLGDPGAEILERAGQCYPLIDGQPLAPVRAFRIAPEEIESLCANPEPTAVAPQGAAVPLNAASDEDAADEQEVERVAETPEPVATETTRPANQLPMAGLLLRVPPRRPAGVPMGPPPITCRLFGTCEIEVNGQPVERTGRAHTIAWELLYLLCSLPEREAKYVYLGGTLSGAGDSKDKLHYVENVVWKLRSKLLAQWLTNEQARRALPVDGKACSLDPTLVSSDVHEFLRLADEAQTARESAIALQAARQAIALYRGDLFGESDPYPWVGALRQQYRTTLVALHARVAEIERSRTAVSRVA